MKKEALRVSTTIPAAPTTLYYAWLSSEQHSAMTGSAAKIDANVGGKFTASDSYISGKLVILDLGRRIVMSWRTTDFPKDAPDSRVEIHFEANGASTRLTILHTDIPEGQGEKYRAVWNEQYFTPMVAFFTKYLPDPRKPPPPRLPPPPEEDDEEEEAPPPPKKVGGKAAALAKIQAARAAKAAAKGLPPPTSKKAPPAPASKKSVPAAPASKVAKAPAAKTAKAPAKAAKPAPKAAAKKAPAPATKKPAAKKPAAAAKKAPAKKPAAKKPAAPAKKKKK